MIVTRARDAFLLILIPAALLLAPRAAGGSGPCCAAPADTHAVAIAVMSEPDVEALDVDAQIAAALARAEEAIQEIIAVPDRERTYLNTLGALDDLLVRLSIDTNMPQFMAYVSTDAAEREAGQRAEERVDAFGIELSQREDLYRAVRAYADSKPHLTGEQARLLEHTLRDYRRAGMELSGEERSRLMEIRKELSRLGIAFHANIREDETRVPLTREELAGMNEEYLGQLPRSGDIYLVGMSYPESTPLLTFCENEDTRKKVWIAFKRRGGQKNIQVLERILALRAEASETLGYRHAADFEIEIRMAQNADTVRAFYEKLRPLVRVKAEQDYREFVAAKREHTDNPNAQLYPWDFAFYRNRLLQERYAVDSQVVQQYFPLEAAIEGLFSITQSIFGLEYVEITDKARSAGRPMWHEDVRLFEVHDKASGEMLGEFYIDLHPRPNKYSHAAQWTLVPRKVWSDGRVQKPLAALVCNFTKPTADRPSLLTHQEIETFFHEFGHCLHEILTEATTGRFAGTNVERDFVEAPAQFFEHWVWNAESLNTFARHYETGERLPEELLNGMIAARHLGSGMLAERQFYYGLVDLTYHTAPEGKVDTTQVQHELFREVKLYDEVPETYFQAGFGHLVGYQAGYYGYQWSLVYAVDMFQPFIERGILSEEAGRRYRDMILATGGTKDGLDMVRDYLGREPDETPYLRHLGLDVDD